MVLDQFANLDKILILGFAREGRSTYKFLRSRFPNLEIGLADRNKPDIIPDDPKIKTFFGPSYLSSIPNYPLIIKSPGISPHKPEIIAAVKRGTLFTSHTRIFFEVCKGNIIGITGTKGKSTTSSLIHHVLSRNNIKSVLVGNIGKPALDFLPDISPETWIIMELSSYQLMDMTVSPHIAVLQNIYPDHLDYHESFTEYVEAKRNIARFQKPGDYFVYNNDFPLPAQTVKLTPAYKLPFSLLDYDKQISTRLLGSHNKYNILPSVVIGRLLHIPREKIYSAIASFTPLDTRLQLVGSVKDIRFYEDTLATIPEASIAAIEALHPDVETLIAGGHERRQDYSNLAKKILDSNIKNLIIFPATGPRLAQELEKLNPQTATPKINIFYTESMLAAVKFALDHTASGKICLLSPAAPSFTLFKDYRDEGAQYRQAIRQLSL